MSLKQHSRGILTPISRSEENSSASKSLCFGPSICTPSANPVRPFSEECTQISPEILSYSGFEIPETQGTQLTSTPVRASTKGKTASGSVKITIYYPSKTANKVVATPYENLVKALFYGVPSSIASAVMNCDPVRIEVVKKVLGVVSQEVNGLCSRREPSLLRKCNKDDLMKFDFQALCKEWQLRAPLFYAFLISCSCKKSSDTTWLPSVGVAGSILLKQRNPQMNATATVLGVLLKSRSIEANLARLSKMKVTCANRTVLAKMEVLGENHFTNLTKVQERITEENAAVKEKQSVLSVLKASNAQHEQCSTHCIGNIWKAHSELRGLQSSCHPGFIIAFDNIDMQLNRRNMTLSAQNRTYHWVNHKVITNRISGSEFSSESPISDVLDVPNVKFMPSFSEHQQQRHDYIILVSRVLVEYFDAFEPLKIVCVQHIPHKYIREMSEKSSKEPLGVIFRNENVNEDMLEILKKFQTYLPRKADGEYDSQLFAGDQLSVERAVNVIASVANGYSPEDRLEGINLQLGDWHAGLKLLSMIYQRFFSGKSEVDNCTLFSDRPLINRRNVTGDTKASYRANRDFLKAVLKSRVIAAAMKVLGIQGKSSKPWKYPLPPSNAKKAEKGDYLIKVSSIIVDEFIFQQSHVDRLVNGTLMEQERQDIINNQQLTEDGKFPCRFPGCTKSFVYDGKSRRKHELTHSPPPDVPEAIPLSPAKPKQDEESPKQSPEDDVLNYNCALLQDGFLFLNFLDAVQEDDGPRIIRQYKYIMLYCKADGTHSTKYALECLYQFFLIYALLTPRDSIRFIWNRSVNNASKIGSNIPLDLDVEHSNNFIKQAIKNLGPNVTEKAITRISNSESSVRSIISKIDGELLRMSRSGKHSQSSEEKDLEELIKRVQLENVFEKCDGRALTHYNSFVRDRLHSLEMSEVFQWINKHKKNINIGIRAR